jgi:hypothetical protein
MPASLERWNQLGQKGNEALAADAARRLPNSRQGRFQFMIIWGGAGTARPFFRVHCACHQLDGVFAAVSGGRLEAIQ